jgi:class 3 adenylate cyclase
MYYVVFGMGLTMILPLCFVVIVGSVIIISHRIADHRPLIYAQLICITWISALIQWSIGSMDQSGLVIAWSFLGPLGALIFLSSRQAILWMVMFIVIVIVSAFLEPSLLGYNQTVSDQTRNLFYILNLGVSATVVFAASVWFVGTIQIERGRSEILLQKIRALFGQHVSREVANELISHGKEESGSRAYEVTIMFLDIRDFTILADSRAPNEVATLQNTVFSELINIVRANKGIVIQILGDGIMAVFGAPVVSDTHENDAVIAGYDMIEIIKELTIQGKIPSIRVGIGLHAGKVIAGEVGNEYRKLYSLAGSNVIIAARIEQLNKDLNSQFLISETVYQKINHLENTMTFLGLKNLKGISNSIGIYQLA